MHIKLVLSQLNDWKLESEFQKHVKKQKYLKSIGDMGRMAEAANVMVLF
jgi:pterin-4a-carbinolamine dehydratase